MTGQITWRGYIIYNDQKAELAGPCMIKSQDCLHFDDDLLIEGQEKYIISVYSYQSNCLSVQSGTAHSVCVSFRFVYILKSCIFEVG
jgi:hypothetical protein